MPVKIIAFCCNWCSYAGADLAGTSRLPYPAQVSIVRVPCSCRVDPMFILRAFGRGADGVLVCGCHPGDCHYISGNTHTQRRMNTLFGLLDFIGIEKDRLRLEWISASEGTKFASVMADFTLRVGELEKQKCAKNTLQLSNMDAPPPEAPMELLPAMRERARELLASGTVQRVLAWERDIFFETHPAPAFFCSPESLEKMVYNRFCKTNLSKYIIEAPQAEETARTLVFLRPCDAHSFARLLAENQIKREQVHIIGVGCAGCVAVSEGEERGLYESCRTCTNTDYPVYDELIGADMNPRAADASARFADAARLEAATADERYAFWHDMLSRCIRCNACRNSCPTCHCKTCVFDGEQYDARNKANITPFDGSFFHIIRAYHQAGRCTDCGQCARACPQGIPLHLLNRKLIKDAQEDICTAHA